MILNGLPKRSSCHFWVWHCILDSFVDQDDYSISYKGFLPTIVVILVIWVSPLLHGKLNGKRLQEWQISSSWTPKSLQIVTAVINQKMTASWKEGSDKPGQCVENQLHYSADKGPYVQGYGLPNGHVQLWELVHKEGGMAKNWCLQTWCWRRLLKFPCTTWRSNQSIVRRSTLNIHWKDWC